MKKIILCFFACGILLPSFLHLPMQAMPGIATQREGDTEWQENVAEAGGGTENQATASTATVGTVVAVGVAVLALGLGLVSVILAFVYVFGGRAREK